MGVATNEEQSADVRDLQQVDASTWPQRTFPEAAGRLAGVIPIVIKQSILNAIHRHGQERTDVEICGVLVGNGYRDDEGPFLYIEGAIRGDHAESQLAQVTFTAGTWHHIHTILDSVWPEHRILAWYHTHPGFGIFLSGMDLFIHENFFGASHQFAIVYDPLSGEEGCFAWDQGQPVKVRCLVEPDEVAEASIKEQSDSGDGAQAEARADLQPADCQGEIIRLRRWTRGLAIGLAAVALIAIAWPALLWNFLGPEAKRDPGMPSEVEAPRKTPSQKIQMDPIEDSELPSPERRESNQKQEIQRPELGSQERPTND